MIYISKDKRERVQSLLNECTEHINALLNNKVIITLRVSPAEIDEELIREKVCESFELSWKDIYSHRRDRHTSNARMCYCYLLRTYLNLSYTVIGKMVNRDHSTIMHEVRKIAGYLTVKDENIEEHLVPIIHYLNAINEPQ